MTALARIDPKAAQFSEDFSAHRAQLPGASLGWLDERRARAMENFTRVGVPHRRVEAWKYTDVAQAIETGLQATAPFRGPVDAALLADPFAAATGATITLVDGFLTNTGKPAPGVDVLDLAKIDASVPEWVKQHLGTQAVGEDQPLGALSFALARGGVAIRIAKGTDASLHLVFAATAREAAAQHARVLIVVEENASLALLESHGAAQGIVGTLVNLGTEIVLGQNARLDHVRLQTSAPGLLHIASAGVRLARDARYKGLFVALGAKLARLDMNVQLAGEGAEAQLHGVAALAHDAHADVTTVMEHASPHTNSRQLFKSVLGHETRSVMQGRVAVREGAQKSDSHQLFKAVLLSERAEADAKPELEIFADDVVCGHGSAIGALDEDSLFYLRARGIPESEARTLLVRAFLEDALEGFADEAVHEALWRSLDAALAQMDGAKG
jgi:Fe-S cluster assembly protein SufD